MSIDTTNSLLTLTGVRQYLGTTGTTSPNGRLEELINVVSHRFNSETGRYLKSRSHTTYMDGNGKDHVYLDQFPVSTASTNIDVRIDTDWGFSTSDKVGSTDIRIYANEGRIFINNVAFSEGEQSVKIVYTAGYTVSSTSADSTTGTLPYDLGYAAKEMIQLLYAREQRGGAGIGIRSESVEGGSITYEDGMPWSVRQVLNKYKDRRYG